jgi:FkbM family methyltransferase
VRDAADIAILREIFVDNEYATSEELRAHHIVDIGGHAGFASVYFALRFPDAEIRTFEPDPENFALLKMNTAKFTRIAARQAAVTARGGATAFFVNESSISSSLERRDGGREIAVSSFSLDEILTEGPADLIKFDVEGAEYDIFSATEKVSACAAYVGELHYDLIGHTKQEFLALFPGYELLERQIGKQRSIVHLTARER